MKAASVPETRGRAEPRGASKTVARQQFDGLVVSLDEPEQQDTKGPEL